MSARIFIGSPFQDNDHQLLNACKQVQQHSPAWRIVQPDSWHVTYAFPGNVSDEKLQEAMDVTRLIAQDFKPLRMEAERLVWMPAKEPTMLWLQMKSTPAFEELFFAFHRELGIEPHYAPNPHVTIMRGNFKRLNALDLPKIDASQMQQFFFGINLYRSFLQPGGSRYEVLRSNPLK